MKFRVIFFLKYFASWILILMLFKLLFIIYYLDSFQQVRFVDFILIFVHGLKLDLSLVAYMVIIPILLFILLFWVNNHLEFRLIYIYTISVLISITILYVIDLVLYSYWKYRLDYTFLDYIETPGEMLANLRWYQYFILAGALFVSYLFCCKLIFKKLFIDARKHPGGGTWSTGIVFLFILAGLIMPGRGGAGPATLNSGVVYFHKIPIVNHAAMNPVWNFVYSLIEKQGMEFKEEFFDRNTENKLLEPLRVSSGETMKVLKTNRPNIIFIILESFTAHIIERNSGIAGVAPNLNRLINEGIYFENFFASGDASARGLGAIFSGYPALPNTYILKYENKVEHIPGICKDLSVIGYTNRFFYGGDINFAHLNSYLIHNRFDEIISIKDFPVSDRSSNWGVPDHIVFKRFLEETNKTKSPFCHVIFTLSSHAPYDVPMDPVFKGNSKDIRFYNSIYYTDKALGDFIRNAKSQSWWDSTLIFISADHGAVYGDVINHDIRRFHIPMLLLGGTLSVTDTIISKYGSQTDIAATLYGQMNLNAEDYKFSRNLLAGDSLSYAFYAFHKGIGYLDDTSYVVYDITSSQFIEDEDHNDETQHDRVKAILQNIWCDFADR